MPRNIFIATVFLAGVLAGLLIPWFGGVYAVQTEPQPVDAPGVSADADGTADNSVDVDAAKSALAAAPGLTYGAAESGDNSEEEDESALTWSELQNATIPADAYVGISPVTLTNGKFVTEHGDGRLSIGYWLNDLHAFGDLNGDGVDDAAVVLRKN